MGQAIGNEQNMRLFYLDLLRCIAIIFLLISHIGLKLNSSFVYWGSIYGFYNASFGVVAVTIFLIISGAVLEYNYGNSIINVPQFMIKRILRIYPVYYLSLILGICVFSFRSYYLTGSFLYNFKQLGLSDIILSITASYAYVGQWGGPFVETSWFIILIMTLYLIFPYLSKIIKKKPLNSFIVLLLISVSSRLIFSKFHLLLKNPLEWFPLCRLFEFSLGIYIAILFLNKKRNTIINSSFFSEIISFISILSFPLFLFHYPLLFLLKLLPKYGLGQTTSIIIYLFVSIFLSWIALKIDNKVPRKQIVNSFNKFFC